MPYFTYVLQSRQNGFFYIGSTANVGQRLGLHNQGRVRSTKAYRPWHLLEYHEFQTRSEAVKHELFLKQHQQKEKLKDKYKTT